MLAVVAQAALIQSWTAWNCWVVYDGWLGVALAYTVMVVPYAVVILMVAQSMGQPLRTVPDALACHVAQQYQAPMGEDDDIALEWAAHLRLLEDAHPDYKK